MGAKFSNSSWNPKNFQTYNTPLATDFSNNRDSNSLDYDNSSEIPSIVVDYSEEYNKANNMMPSVFYPNRNCENSEFVSYLQNPESNLSDIATTEPQVFPKLTAENRSPPVNNSNWFRIHPIKQKGVKLSDTHYWIINEPKHKRCYSARVKRNPPEMYVNASSFGSDQYEEPDLPYDLNEQISQEYSRTRPVKRGKSENSKSYLFNMHRGLVIRMMLKIPSASEMECNSVLIGANWDFNIAEKRLKVDMLHRRGYVNQQRCTQLLEKYQWNLEEAECQAEKEFKLMQLEKQSNNSSRSHFSDDIG